MSNKTPTPRTSGRPKVALIYDFDGTLSPGNMQEFGFIQAIGKNPEEFWYETNKLSRDASADGVLSYMYVMLQKAIENRKSLDKERLRAFGKHIALYEGVETWFRRINYYGDSIGLEINHYVVSSGLVEMIEGSPIAREFKNIYACQYLYNEQGEAYWPAIAVNFTTKTQYLHKINKGVEEIEDDVRVNAYVPPSERPVPFTHMIYFGDGTTDIPCMRMLMKYGGHAVAVYAPDNERKKALAAQLRQEGRVHYAAPANYNPGSPLEDLVRAILRKIQADNFLLRF